MDLLFSCAPASRAGRCPLLSPGNSLHVPRPPEQVTKLALDNWYKAVKQFMQTEHPSATPGLITSSLDSALQDRLPRILYSLNALVDAIQGKDIAVLSDGTPLPALEFADSKVRGGFATKAEFMRRLVLPVWCGVVCSGWMCQRHCPDSRSSCRLDPSFAKTSTGVYFPG